MGSVTGNSINFKELCELIDLYKRASIDGDRISLIVQPHEDNILLTIKLQNGYSIKPSSYLFEDKELFNNSIYPELLNVFAAGDTVGGWTINPIDDENSLGTIETQSGNLVYLKTNDNDLFKSLKDKIEFRKSTLFNQDKIWDEIIRYARNRKVLADIALSEEELDRVYIFIVALATNDHNVKCNSLKENENYLKELFNDKGKMLENGLKDELLDKINPTMLKQLAQLLECEKRIRYRLDTDNVNIRARIQFAAFELDGCGYFDLKNRITRESPTIKCKMGVISKLLSKLNYSNLYNEKLRDFYKEYCYEMVGYLYRRGIKKEYENKFDSIEFKEYTDKEEKNTNELSFKEIEEIISSVEESKASTSDRKEMFTIIRPKAEKQESYDITEIKDAYEKSLNYSTESSPAWIKILFEDENDTDADVIISNQTGSQDLVLYRRSIDIDKLKGEIMDTLRKLFTKNNSIHHNLKFKMATTNSYCLLMIGDKKTTFSIVNAPDDFVNDNKKKLEELMGYKN